ncbi:50S ribosomal protein L18 [Candidatus Gracilibacteria bacterium]|nr:50S ribosomal protein L18 [Candidatus Gracilibacteria bacterium]
MNKESSRARRHVKIRARMRNNEKPRLIVFKSVRYNYVQLFDDKTGKVIVASSDIKDNSKANKVEKAKAVGADIAKKAIEKNITEVAFDRNGYKYHGRIKALADGAREAGLKF